MIKRLNIKLNLKIKIRRVESGRNTPSKKACQFTLINKNSIQFKMVRPN